MDELIYQRPAQEGFDIVGLDNATAMLSEARRRCMEASQQVRDRLTLLEGDMRHWKARASDPEGASGVSTCGVRRSLAR